MQWSVNQLIFGDGIAAEIFWRVRIPRVLLGLFTGAALGCAGVVFQALFRNPLASPYTFGVASGASFGAASAIVLGLTGSVFGVYGVTFGGILGALFVTSLIYFVATRGNTSSIHMLLAGVAMSFFFSSLLLFAQYLSNFTQSFQIVRWLMGGLETIDYHSLSCLIPFVLIGVSLALLSAKELDAIATGDELAYSRGVNVEGTRRLLFFVSSIMIGTVVSFTGPIGFVGIMIPHFCRLLLGASHRILTPCAILASGVFLVVCDTVARIIVAPADLPVGIITSLLGGPFFIWILLRRKDGIY
ncbi:UNVERIFIED_CONTAM: hypothetical protein GTU68_025489 [Idotea baltica]|nr:hypothetical protein [Idotea baltica]